MTPPAETIGGLLGTAACSLRGFKLKPANDYCEPMFEKTLLGLFPLTA
jgi:hypothetical protein